MKSLPTHLSPVANYNFNKNNRDTDLKSAEV